MTPRKGHHFSYSLLHHSAGRDPCHTAISQCILLLLPKTTTTLSARFGNLEGLFHVCDVATVVANILTVLSSEVPPQLGGWAVYETPLSPGRVQWLRTPTYSEGAGFLRR